MDAHNRFHTRSTYALVRSDYLALLVAMLWLLLTHYREVRWLPFLAAFAWIDFAGYLPGAIWYRTRARGGERPMPVAFIAAYDIAHNVALNLGIIALWYACAGQFEWAMLAAPIHLCIDRGFFGNIYKSRALSFEPIAHKDFAAFSLALERAGTWPGKAALGLHRAGEVDEPTVPRAVEQLVSRLSDHPSIGLVFNRDTQYFTTPDLEGFVAYRRRGRTMFCIGGPVAEVHLRSTLLDAFLRDARQQRCKVVAVQVREQDVELFHRLGFRVNQMGCSYTLSLADFSLSGGRFVKLRNKIKQPAKAGIVVRELTGGGEPPDVLVGKLDQVSGAWLQAKGSHVKELRFLVGEVESLKRKGTRCFGALRGEEIIAFITYVPSYGKLAGYMHDLTRRRPDCPAGTLEAINCCAIETFKKEGVEHLCFGFTPLVGIADTHPSHSRLIARLFRLMADKADFIYPAASQEAYKRKWHPQFVEPEYMVFQGRFALTSLWNFLRLTRAV